MDQQQEEKVICMQCTKSRGQANPTTAGSGSGCMYDFVILNSDKDKSLSEKFFTILEQKYRLKGYHGKRDCILGVIKQRQLVKTLQTSKFVIELISKESSEERSFKRLRSIAHEVECKKGESGHPEVLPIFVEIPREEQRTFTTTVGRSYVDRSNFWEELASYMLGIPFPLSPRSPNLPSQISFQDSLSADAANNNSVPKKESAKKNYRRKHKIFRGLLKARRSKQEVKRKSKKKLKLKSLRRLLLCVPARSRTVQDSANSPPINGQSMSSIAAVESTARQDSLEEDHSQTSRMEISRA